MYQRLAFGHLPAGYGSYVPWGLWIALYFHAVGIAAGTFILGGVAFLMGWRDEKTLRTVVMLSIAALSAGFLAVLLDLGHIGRAYRMFTSPSFTSMMAFNAWMYSLFAVLALIAWWLSFRKEPSVWLRPVIAVAMLLAILFTSQSGAFFGAVEGKAFWNSALMPLLFFASAITAGASTLFVVRWLMGPETHEEGTESHARSLLRLRWYTLIGLLVYFWLEFAEFSIALWSPYDHSPAVRLVLFGPYWWVFWVVHLLIGGVIPVVLLARKQIDLWPWAALLVAVTLVSARLNVLIPGQAVSQLKGLQEAFFDPRLQYVYRATVMEYLVGFFLLAVAAAVFYVGRRVTQVVASKSEQTTR
jgi:molybdopterin-containing oxidoreductase family membrane subunit